MQTTNSPIAHFSKIPRLIGLALSVLLLVRVVVLWLGIDHLTTVSWTTPMSLSIAVAIGLLVSFVLFCHHRSAAASWQSDESRQPWTKGLWGRLFVVGAIGIGTAWAIGSLLGVAAQYLTGDRTEISATVDKVVFFHSARVVCRSEITVVPDAGGGALTFCLLLVNGGRSGPDDILSGERVAIRLKQTLLGNVVESISRPSAPSLHD